jgi:hypothetical protein
LRLTKDRHRNKSTAMLLCLLIQQITTLSVQHILRRIERLKKTLLLPDF